MPKIVLVGAGSLQFGTCMLGDLFQSRLLTTAEVVLNDINQAAALRTLKVAQDFVADHNLDFSITAEPNLEKALVNADFVIISIEVGDRFALWDQDWKIPQQYGIAQIYGENGGPGGLFHSLRIIPPILEICEKVLKIAPSATVFNYSNPMSRICTTVHRKFPELNFIGICHEIASLERFLPSILKTAIDNIEYRAAGLNHFSVMTEVRYKDSGKDAYEGVLQNAEAFFTALPGYSEILSAKRASGTSVETESWIEVDLSHIQDVRPWSDRWLFREIIARFGCFPITTDSHFGEYISWAAECSDHRGILDFYTYYRNFLGDNDPKIEPVLKERVVPIMEGLVTDSGYEEAAVNIPNNGLIEDLPDWLVVEVPAIVNAQGVSGIKTPIPKGFQGLLTNQIGVHNMTAEAVLGGRKDAVIQALMVDPVVTTAAQLPQLVDHMIAEQSPWLDYLK
ncbi:MAG: hypothetical protein ACJZ87_01575 [Paracoccaceae bacterium]